MNLEALWNFEIKNRNEFDYFINANLLSLMHSIFSIYGTTVKLQSDSQQRQSVLII